MRMIFGLQNLVFEQASSSAVVLEGLMSGITLLSLAYLGYSETIGKHLQYSKFWNVVNTTTSSSSGGAGAGAGAGAKAKAKEHNKSFLKLKLSSRTGMLILYAPAFLAGLLSFAFYPNHNHFRFLLLKSALTIHFFKRLFEVVFVHKYSGGMILDSIIVISGFYFMATASMIYFQQLSQGTFQEPSVDLKYVGVVLFLVGISGNFYHHYILSKLRDSNNEKGYKLPQGAGGLFNLVLCPHYLFEIFIFLGISFISQTLFSFSCSIGSALYLTGRSYATRRWYLSKFENFPNDIKALIPYVF